MSHASRSKMMGALHGPLFIALTMATLSVPLFRVWPLFWIVSLAAYLAVVMVVPPLRASFRPWRFGRVTRFSLMAALVIAVGSCAVLVAFHSLRHPDVSGYGRLLPVRALGGTLLAGIAFSVGNALFEELVFRGIFFDAIECIAGIWPAVVGSAIIFGYCHLNGYPPGPLGALLACAYGLCLGGLRMMTGGLGLGFLVHITADATIYFLIAKSGGW